MMGLDERVFYFILGCIVGAIFGYLVKHLQTVEKKVDQMNQIVKQDRGEAGFMRLPTLGRIKIWVKNLKWPSFKDVMLIVVVLMVAYAAFSTQSTNNDLKKNDAADDKQQAAIERISKCNSDFLGQTILALNERTTFSSDQAKSNVALQQEQLRLLTFALSLPPPTAEQGRKSFERYVDRLNTFIDLAKKTANKTSTYQYPTLDEFETCVNKEA